MPLHASGAGMAGTGMVASPGQLTAIDEMPAGLTPLSESRAQTPTRGENPPSFHSESSAGESSTSSKGKQRLDEQETQLARQAGSSTPRGMHDPLTGSE
jgi:hypothetical protein